MGAAVVVIMVKERHVVDAFARAGVTSADRAVVPDDLAVDPYGIGWRRLRERAIVREAAPGSGRFYLDTEVYSAVRRQRRRMAVIMLVIGAIVVIALATEMSVRLS